MKWFMLDKNKHDIYVYCILGIYFSCFYIGDREILEGEQICEF